MEDADLQHIYDQVIVQRTYPGGICPTQRNLARYVKGSLSEPELRNMREHLSSCHACADMAAELESARRWFQENEQSVASQIAEKATRIGLYLGQECPPVQALEKYCVAAVPDTEPGRRFRQRTGEHLSVCTACRHAVNSWGKKLERLVVMTLDELDANITEPLAKKVVELMLRLQAAPAVQRVDGRAYAMPGYRAGPTSSADAIVLDRQGRIVLNDAGQPVRVPFDVIRAQVEQDGHFVLDLCTADQEYWESGTRRFVISATLWGENTRLVLPGEHIRADGRVTVVGRIPAGVEIKALPVSAMSLAIAEDSPAGSTPGR